MVEDILEFNKKFVEDKRYEVYKSGKYPSKRIAILSCMDARLTELLPAALGIRNGDVKIIKNAGGVISHPFGSVIRSLIVAIYELNVEEIMVIGHTDCGVQNLNSNRLIEKMKQRGISEGNIEMMKFCGIDFDNWLNGFGHLEESILRSIDMIKSHPLIPKDINVSGFIMDSETGKLSVVKMH